MNDEEQEFVADLIDHEDTRSTWFPTLLGAALLVVVAITFFPKSPANPTPLPTPVATDVVRGTPKPVFIVDAPTPTTPPRQYVLTENGPFGCPVRPTNGEVEVVVGDGKVTLKAPQASVIAVNAGVVTVEGTTVMVTHNPWKTMYQFLARVEVQDGTFIAAGQPIGVTYDFIDYTILKDSVPVDAPALLGC